MQDELNTRLALERSTRVAGRVKHTTRPRTENRWVSFILRMSHPFHMKDNMHQRQKCKWSWSNGGWIYNYLSKQCLSPLTLWIRIMRMTWCTHKLYINVYSFCDCIGTAYTCMNSWKEAFNPIILQKVLYYIHALFIFCFCCCCCFFFVVFLYILVFYCLFCMVVCCCLFVLFFL